MKPQEARLGVIKKVACLGSGFVGGPTSAVMAFKSDARVTVVDVDAKRIAAWNSNSLPIFEPGLDMVVRAARDGMHICDEAKPTTIENLHRDGTTIQSQGHPNLFFSTDVDRAIEEADLIFICVNTPTKPRGFGKGSVPDLSFVEAATRNIARVARSDKIVVEKSTVPCKTAESIQETLLANAQPGINFDVLSNPEFLAEGSAVMDLLHPDRVIIGSHLTQSGLRAAYSLAEIYAQWVPRERIISMSLWSSELSKLAANAMLAQRVSSVNALSAICEATGADVEEVSHACGLDSRIGPRMLRAGPGFGGSCFRKDILSIVYLSESLDLYEVADYWRAIIEINEYQKSRLTKRIVSCLSNSLASKKIAVLGFAFKKNTSDTRESPAITLVSNLLAEGAHVTIYDPKVQDAKILKDLTNEIGDLASLEMGVEVCNSAYEACLAADAIVVITEWDEFSNRSSTDIRKMISAEAVLPEKDRNRSSWVEKPIIVSPTSKTNCGSSRLQNGVREHAPENAKSPGLVGDHENYGYPSDYTPLDWARIARDMKKPGVVFDGRNILDADKLKALGLRVESIGRASSAIRDTGLHDYVET